MGIGTGLAAFAFHLVVPVMAVAGAADGTERDTRFMQASPARGSGPVSVAERSAEVTQAGLALSSLQYLSRLVAERRLPGVFLTKFARLEVLGAAQRSDAQSGAAGTTGAESACGLLFAPVYKVQLSQFSETGQIAPRIDVELNGRGEVISHVVTNGSESTRAPVWPDQDPVSLTVGALRYVVAGAAQDPALGRFDRALQGLTVNAIRDIYGNLLAKVEMRSAETRDILYAFLAPDGTFLGAESASPAPLVTLAE